jgi:hypothetical protein
MTTATITTGQWIDALRSPEYKQGKRHLTKIVDGSSAGMIAISDEM